MGAVVFILIMAFLFLVISIFLFMGKGSWIIAGYNTATPQEKALYDKKKLCRVMGSTCLIVSVLLCVLARLGYKVEAGIMEENAMVPFAIVFVVVIIADIIFDMIFINKKCIVEKQER